MIYRGVKMKADDGKRQSVRDALKAVGIPAVEVHISKVEEREAFRQISYIRAACVKTITGHGISGYLEAMDYLLEYLNCGGKS